MDALEAQRYRAAAFANRESISKSSTCVCYHCLCRFSANAVDNWIEDIKDDTAICPACGIDSVLGDATGLDLSDAVILQVSKKSFGVGDNNE